ncbi:MAG: hypothetical protein RR373_09275, partial [Akkermansia sp.]
MSPIPVANVYTCFKSRDMPPKHHHQVICDEFFSSFQLEGSFDVFQSSCIIKNAKINPEMYITFHDKSNIFDNAKIEGH